MEQALHKLPHLHRLLQLLVTKKELQKEVELLCSALQTLLGVFPVSVGRAISRWPLLLCKDEMCQVRSLTLNQMLLCLKQQSECDCIKILFRQC
jgi:hypothetical protein